MTRINLVDPLYLTDKHLLAEYKEITRPFNKVLKRIGKGTMDQVTIPDRYCLGTGHETFFFDKLKFLWERYESIQVELINRGFLVDKTAYLYIKAYFYNNLSSTKYWNTYNPTPEELYLNMARICKRSNIDNVLDELSKKEL